MKMDTMKSRSDFAENVERLPRFTELGSSNGSCKGALFLILRPSKVEMPARTIPATFRL